MIQHNYIIGPVDTDSISFCKQDGSEFSKEEITELIKEINEISPEFMIWENDHSQGDGCYKKCIALKAKNYILYDPTNEKKPLTIKGSAFKSANKEKALKDLMNDCIDALLHDREQDIVTIYERYIQEAMNITDISRWAVKKSISKKTMESTRKNETKIMDAISDEHFQEGDKVYLYSHIDGDIQIESKGIPQFYKDGKPKTKPNEIMKLTKKWTPGDENKLHYVKRVYATMKILGNVIDMSKIIDYTSKKNQSLLFEKFGS